MSHPQFTAPAFHQAQVHIGSVQAPLQGAVLEIRLNPQTSVFQIVDMQHAREQASFVLRGSGEKISAYLTFQGNALYKRYDMQLHSDPLRIIKPLAAERAMAEQNLKTGRYTREHAGLTPEQTGYIFLAAEQGYNVIGNAQAAVMMRQCAEWSFTTPEQFAENVRSHFLRQTSKPGFFSRLLCL